MADDSEQVLKIGAIIDLSQVLPGLQELSTATAETVGQMGDVFATAGEATQTFDAKLVQSSATVLNLKAQLAEAKAAIRETEEVILDAGGANEVAASMLKNYSAEQLNATTIQKQLNAAIAEYKVLLDEAATVKLAPAATATSVSAAPGIGDPFAVARPVVTPVGAGPRAEDIDQAALAAENSAAIRSEAAANQQESVALAGVRTQQVQTTESITQSIQIDEQAVTAIQRQAETIFFLRTTLAEQRTALEETRTAIKGVATGSEEASALTRQYAQQQVEIEITTNRLNTALKENKALIQETARAALAPPPPVATLPPAGDRAAAQYRTGSGAGEAEDIDAQADAEAKLTEATNTAAAATQASVAAATDSAGANTEEAAAIAADTQAIVEYNVEKRAALAATTEGMAAIQAFAAAQAEANAVSASLIGVTQKSAEQEAELAAVRQAAADAFANMTKAEADLGNTRAQTIVQTGALAKSSALAATETGALTSWSVKLAAQLKAQGLSAADASSALINQGASAEEAALALQFVGYAAEKTATDLEAVGASAAATGGQMSGMVSRMGAARVEMGALTGNAGAMEFGLARVIGQSVLLGPILEAAFPAFAILAVVDILSAGIEKLEKWKDLANQTVHGMDDLTFSILKQEDALDLTNLKLENTIALFHGQPQNLVAVALEEAKMKADDLAKSLEDDFEKMQKIMEAGPGFWSSFILGSANISAFADEFKPLQQNIEQANLALIGATTEEEKAAAQAQIHNALLDAREKIEKKLTEEKSQRAVLSEGPEGPVSVGRNPDPKSIAILQQNLNQIDSLIKQQYESRMLESKEVEHAEDEQSKQSLDRTSKETETQLASERTVAEAKAKYAEQISTKGEYTIAPNQRALQEEIAQRAETDAAKAALQQRLNIEQQYVREGIGDHVGQVKELESQIIAVEIEGQTKIQQIRYTGYEQDRRNAEEETIFFADQQSKHLDAVIRTEELIRQIKNKDALDDIKISEQQTVRTIDIQETKATSIDKVDQGAVGLSGLNSNQRAVKLAQMQRDELEQTKQFEQQKLQAKLDAASKEAELQLQQSPELANPDYAPNPENKQESEQYAKDLAAYKTAQAAKKAAADDLTKAQIADAAAIQLANQKVIQAEVAMWQQGFNQINAGLNTFISSTLKGTVTVHEAFRRMGEQLVTSMIQSLAQLVVKFAEHELLLTVIHMTQTEAQVAQTASAAGQTKAIESASTISSLGKSAASAAGKAWDALSGIPVIGPELGAAAAAATFAAVLGLGALAGAEQGALIPQDMPLFVHSGEMVLPSHLSQGVQSMVRAGSGGRDDGPQGPNKGAPSSTTQNQISITAFDGKSVEDMLRRNSGVFTRTITSRIRNGYRGK